MTQTMRNATSEAGAMPLLVRVAPVVHLTDDQLFQLCGLNRELRIERTTQGDLVIMPPTGGETGRENAELTASVALWAREHPEGVVFGSNAGFLLPNGAMRSPDVAWVRRSRWEALAPELRQKFPPLCPDFVVELRSPSDRLPDLQAKMREYMENGAQLGWLIDPLQKNVYVYRAGASSAETLHNPAAVSGDPVLPGFVLELARIWG